MSNYTYADDRTKINISNKNGFRYYDRPNKYKTESFNLCERAYSHVNRGVFLNIATW